MDYKILEQIKEIEHDIETIKIQGATNTALATLKGMLLVARSSNVTLLDIEEVGFRLSEARVNEPLARNAVRFVLSAIKKDSSREVRLSVEKAITDFKTLLQEAKDKIKSTAVSTLADRSTVLTHCHSSTTEVALVELSRKKSDFKVVATETRPLYQGRITAKHLLENNVDVYMIVDSVAPAFIVQDKYLVVDTVLVGCDELLQNGDIINKIGTFGLALACEKANDELYVMTTLLKLDFEKQDAGLDIEIRSAKEIWADAPDKLRLINPAFDLVSSDLITGYITEAGLLKREELSQKAKELYNWL